MDDLKFIKVSDNYGFEDFYINPKYIVTIRSYKQIVLKESGTDEEMRYAIEYYDEHHNLVGGHISEEDYEYLINKRKKEK